MNTRVVPVHLGVFKRRIAQTSMVSLPEAIASFMFPGNGTPHRNRSWYVEIVEGDENMIGGLLGFDWRRRETGLRFDPATGRFGEIETEVPLGTAASFVIDPSSGYCAYEEVPSSMGAPGVGAGVFREVMTKLARDYDYALEPIADIESFYDWVRETAVIESITITVQPPNPHPGSDLFGDLKGDLHDPLKGGAFRSTHTLSAPEGSSLSPTDSEFVKDAVGRQQHGEQVKISGSGRTEDNRPSRYRQGRVPLTTTMERADAVPKTTLMAMLEEKYRELRRALADKIDV